MPTQQSLGSKNQIWNPVQSHAQTAVKVVYGWEVQSNFGINETLHYYVASLLRSILLLCCMLFWYFFYLHCLLCFSFSFCQYGQCKWQWLKKPYSIVLKIYWKTVRFFRKCNPVLSEKFYSTKISCSEANAWPHFVSILYYKFLHSFTLPHGQHSITFLTMKKQENIETSMVRSIMFFHLLLTFFGSTKSWI